MPPLAPPTPDARNRWPALGAILLSLGLAGGWAIWRFRPDPQPPLPLVAGRPESCLSCHAGMTGFAPAHDPSAIGCASCHLGDRLARTADAAHAGMTRTPGNLSFINQTCASASCHEAIGQRVRGSLMNTMSGVVAVDKFVFGENPDLDRPYDIARVGHSPADTHLRTLCASCHLGHDKPAPAPIDEQSRSGGCSACHLDYGPRAAEELARRGRPGLAPIAPQAHPMISLRVPDQACFGCHSRSGRIATNYEGWHETLLDEAHARNSPAWPAEFRVLGDGRVFEKKPADVHFEKGLACVDCHVAAEVMGDGQAHAHQEDAIKISCRDCHPAQAPAARPLAEYDRESQMIFTLRGLARDDRRPVSTANGDVAHSNTFVDSNGAISVVRQRDGVVLTPKRSGPACQRDAGGHAALDCRACHSAWTSQCVSCHAETAPAVRGWDHLAQRETRDSWTEHAADFFSDPPTLGVVTNPSAGASRRTITTFAPGMVLTLQPSAPGEKKPALFRRLFAPVSPHTISGRSRDCRSCHNNPVALGYGRGTLGFEPGGATGVWRFMPELPLRAEDGLPRDAWIGFLQEPPPNSTTRLNARPFTLREQQAILRVGACLTCHSPDHPALQSSTSDFATQLSRLSPHCSVPAWPK